MKFAFNRKLLGLLAICLLILTVFAYRVVFSMHEGVLRVSFLDVGQGDSILIEGPTGKEVLIDGGPDRSVVRELGTLLGPLDRSIAMVVATHPDTDHIFGLVPVLETYRVGAFLESGVPNDTTTSRALHASMNDEEGMEHVIARRGMRILIGGGAYADVLYPYQEDVSHLDTNDASIVIRVVYGKTSFLLSGDLASSFEDKLVSLDGERGALDSTVLKAGHHGSKYSTDMLWLGAVSPEVLVISAGKDNSYGHPSPLVTARAARAGISVVSTQTKGTIHFISDGKTVLQR